MGIISRFKDIMEANINAIFDKWEDPAKMIDQYLRNLESDLSSVKAETASVIAEEKAAKRALDDCNSEIAKMTEYAKRALTAGNEDEARQFLSKKTEYDQKLAVLNQQYTLCCENSMKMREMHDKLEMDISELRSRREILKAKAKVAETQKKMNKFSSISGAGKNLSKFEEMEAKINRELDEAEAMAELSQSSSKTEDISALEAKYNDGASSANVDAELEALKAQMGLSSTN